MSTAPDSSPTISTPEDRRIRTTRARFAFEAVMADRLHSPTRKVFGWRNWWLTRTYERLWPFAATWAAVCTLASLPDHMGVRDVLPLFLEGLPAYHRDGPAVLTGRGPVGFEPAVVPPLGRGGEPSFGDNAWLGLALVRHQELAHDEVSVPLAARVFQFVVSGWSTEDTWVLPGGIRSTATSATRRTCDNAGTVILAGLLHRLTGDSNALEWAIRIYRWTRGALLLEDGLYADRIEPDGIVAPDVWTHNQGAMLGAGVLLARATGDADFLADVRVTAVAACERFGLDDLIENGPARNAVYLRNLFALPSGLFPDAIAVPPREDEPQHLGAPKDSRRTPLAAARALAGDYDDLLWEERDQRSGWFPGSGSPLSRMGPLIEIDALLAGAPPQL